MRKNPGLLILILLLAVTLFAEETKLSQSIDNWLVTEVAYVQKPLFSGEENINGDSWSEKDILEQPYSIERNLHPKNGTTINWSHGQELKWQVQAGEEITLKNPSPDNLGLAYLAFYIENDEWMEATLELTSTQLLRVWLDDEIIGSKTDDTDFLNTLNLETGRHKVVIKSLTKSESIDSWSISGLIKSNQPVKLSTDPTNYMTVDKLLYSEKVTDVKISYDGEYSAITLHNVDKEEKENDYYIDIRNSDDGDLVRSFRGGMTINSLKWSPVANEYIYKTNDGGKSSLWLANIETGENKKILQNIENLGSYAWSPVGDYLIYTASVKEEKEKSGVRKLKHMPDRQPGNRKVT